LLSPELIRLAMQRMNMFGSSNPILDDDTCISEELIGRLHNATEGSVPDLVAAFTSNERASLAVFCYHKSHLRRIGLAIARTCDLTSLVQEWGVILGQAVFFSIARTFRGNRSNGGAPTTEDHARSFGRSSLSSANRSR
jgi:hypothetical protein